MDIELTNEELSRIDSLRISLEDMGLEAPQWRSKPILRKGESQLPLEHEAASESFLVAELEGRARLSDETRLREERRLALRARRRKRHGGASRGRRHWKRKLQTKEKALDRAYDRDAYQWFMRACKMPLDITREEYNKYLAEIFENYPRKSLTWRRHHWAPNGNVYSLILTYNPKDSRGKPKPPVVVYDGEEHIFQDVCIPALAERVHKLTTKK